MEPRHWNKLYSRCVKVIRDRCLSGQDRRNLVRRWLRTMERRTGKVCFFLPAGD